MLFTSDNAHGAAPEILEAMARANAGGMPSYGADTIMEGVEERLRDIFGTDLRAFMVTTGTAANALALASVSPPWGAVFCHRHSHIQEDECGAPEFFGGGLKLVLLEGDHAKINPASLEAALDETGPRGVHQVQPAALSVTNVTEFGAVYTPDKVAELAGLAKARGAATHLSGARFGNALVAGDASAADMTWRAGVDVLSFGATKNGCLAAEAVIFFDPDRQRERIAEFEFRRKRGGHLLSKGRLLSAQMEGYLANDLWLDLARRGNAAAAALAEGLRTCHGVENLHPVDANMMFVRLPIAAHRALRAAGAQYYLEPAHQTEDGDGESVGARLVCGFATEMAEVEQFIATIRAAV